MYGIHELKKIISETEEELVVQRPVINKRSALGSFREKVVDVMKNMIKDLGKGLVVLVAILGFCTAIANLDATVKQGHALSELKQHMREYHPEAKFTDVKFKEDGYRIVPEAGN